MRTWPYQIDVPVSGVSTADIGNVPNGMDYVCRAFALNAAGLSDPSEPSDAVRLCGSLLDCNPVLRPVLGILGFLAVTGVLLTLLALYRRTRGYVVAVVDVVHTANLGHGSRLGIAFVRTRPGGPVTGIAADRGRNPDVRIRWLRGNRFEVRDSVGRYVTKSGERVVDDRFPRRPPRSRPARVPNGDGVAGDEPRVGAVTLVAPRPAAP